MSAKANCPLRFKLHKLQPPILHSLNNLTSLLVLSEIFGRKIPLCFSLLALNSCFLYNSIVLGSSLWVTDNILYTAHIISHES